MATPEVSDFLAVLRSGDEQAVEQLLRRLDPILRQIIHLRLVDGRLRRLVDTTDIVQSLLKNFLCQGTNGPPTELGPDGLYAWLAAAVHHKIFTKVRKERRHLGSLPDSWEPVSPEPPPVECVEGQDFLQQIRARLPEPVGRLFDLKLQGLSWAATAEQVGGEADALRMRLRRAVTAVLAELESEEVNHAGRGSAGRGPGRAAPRLDGGQADPGG
jgi:DNA-directed RNA polymerase specialized sigma24 family protein